MRLETLSSAIARRASLVRLKKIVNAIASSARDESIRRLALEAINHIVAMAPELKELNSTEKDGTSNTSSNRYGRAAEQVVAASLFGRQ